MVAIGMLGRARPRHRNAGAGLVNATGTFADGIDLRQWARAIDYDRGRLITSIMGGVRVAPQVNDPQLEPRKYMQLANMLRQNIHDGTLAPGDRVPSITDLSAERGWARQTCAQALHALEDEGLLQLVPGLGYHIANPAAESGTSASENQTSP